MIEFIWLAVIGIIVLGFFLVIGNDYISRNRELTRLYKLVVELLKRKYELDSDDPHVIMIDEYTKMCVGEIERLENKRNDLEFNNVESKVMKVLER